MKIIRLKSKQVAFVFSLIWLFQYSKNSFHHKMQSYRVAFKQTVGQQITVYHGNEFGRGCSSWGGNGEMHRIHKEVNSFRVNDFSDGFFSTELSSQNQCAYSTRNKILSNDWRSSFGTFKTNRLQKIGRRRFRNRRKQA